jgi:formate dehydrogenase major subunit
VLVTDRMPSLRVGGQILHHVGLPYHWGPNGLVTGDAANELTHMTLDPNSHIMETNALSCDIRPGRRPRGMARVELLAHYQRRAGVTEFTGTEDRA